ncbi:MAG: amidohydrolase family protein [Thermomicrobiales bacterium]|nr:amidohydrolase family protein [Thermomicrobiales bacterium]
MIVDSHAHIFPYLQHAPGNRHRPFLQRGLNGNQLPVRRTRDNAIVTGVSFWDAHDYSYGGYREVDFRAGKFGRFEWTIDGVDYYKQYMPPSLIDNTCEADYLVAEMDYAGIDVALLQNDHFYGALNEMFRDAVRQFPDRFVGTAHVDETTVGTQGAIDDLHKAAEEFGLRGIFYDSRTYWSGTDADAIDSEKFRSFWRTVESLGLVVYWVPGPPIGSGIEGYLGQLRRWCNLQELCPNLHMVVPGGIPHSLLADASGTLPDEIKQLARSGRVAFELLYPISVGRAQEYPYRDALEEIRALYGECGGAALVWGSDVPNVLRHCTYSQSLEYLRRYADFIPPSDMDQILGGTLARFFGLPSDQPVRSSAATKG